MSKKLSWLMLLLLIIKDTHNDLGLPFIVVSLSLTCTQGTIFLSNIAFRARCVAVEVTVGGEGASADDVVVDIPLTVGVVIAVLEAFILGEHEQVHNGRSLAESGLGTKQDLGLGTIRLTLSIKTCVKFN